MIKKIKIIHFLIAFVCFLGCKDDGDIQSPKIIIEEPADGLHFNVGDKIHVKALITDNEIIESIEVRLNKLSNNSKVGESITFNAGSSIYHLDTYYPILDTLLPTDDYYLTIIAFDGNQEGKAFQKVHITGLSRKKLSDIIIVSDQKESSIIEITNQFNLNYLHTFNLDFGGAVLSTKSQMIYLCGKIDNSLIGYDLKSSSVNWEKTYMSAPTTKTFNYIDIDDQKNNIGVSLTAGYTNVVSSYGAEIMNFQTGIGMIPHRHFMEEELTFIETYSINQSVHKMESFYSLTAAPFDSKNINFQIINVFEIDKSKAIIFSNLDGAAVLYEYTYSSKNIKTADNLLVNDSIINVLQIDQNLYLITGKKHVYKYFLSTESLFELISGVRADVVAYDQLKGEVYIANENILSVYSYSNGNLKKTISLPSEIKKIFFRYNI